jgi:hypothetical protein
MCGVALASILHVAGCPCSSHCHRPIAVSNCCPRIVTVFDIDIAAAVILLVVHIRSPHKDWVKLDLVDILVLDQRTAR